MPKIDFRFSTLKNIENSVIVRITGDWDLSNEFFYGRDLTVPFRKLASKGYSSFIIDFREAKCYDNPFDIGFIDLIIKEIIPKGGKLFIITPDWMREWMKMIGIYERLKIYEAQNITEAIKLLKSANNK